MWLVYRFLLVGLLPLMGIFHHSSLFSTGINRKRRLNAAKMTGTRKKDYQSELIGLDKLYIDNVDIIRKHTAPALQERLKEILIWCWDQGKLAAEMKNIAFLTFYKNQSTKLQLQQSFGRKAPSVLKIVIAVTSQWMPNVYKKFITMIIQLSEAKFGQIHCSSNISRRLSMAKGLNNLYHIETCYNWGRLHGKRLYLHTY